MPYQDLSRLFAPRPAQAERPSHPNDAVELFGLQDRRRRELQERLSNEIGTGDPRAAGRSASLLDFLSEDMAEDPYTGDAAHTQTQGVQDQLDAATTFMRPEITEARQQELGERERLATAPARVAGQYNVQAAQIAGDRDLEQLKLLLGTNVQPGQRLSVAGVGSVGQSNPSAAMMRQGSPTVPTSVQTQYQRAVKDAQPGGLGRLFGRGPDQEALAPARRQYVSNLVSPQLLSYLEQAAPSFTPEMSPEEKFQVLSEQVPDDVQISETEYQSLIRALMEY